MSISKTLNGVNYNSLLKTHGVVRSITSLKNKKKKKGGRKFTLQGYNDLTLQHIALKPCQQGSM